MYQKPITEDKNECAYVLRRKVRSQIKASELVESVGALILSKRYGQFEPTMRIIIILTLCAVATFSLYGQQYDCHRNLFYYEVIKEDGIELLSDWKDGAPSITTLNNGTRISVCGQGTYTSKLIKVFYKDTVGYVNKDFLELLDPVNVVILNRWISDGYPVSDKYFGLFEAEEKYYEGQSIVEECLTKIDTIKADDGTYFQLAQLIQEKVPRIMISGLDIKTGTQNNGQFFDSKFLYPGETIQWGYNNNQYLLYAKGEIVEDTVTTSIDALAKIQNYEFHVRRQVDGVTEDIILYNMDFHKWNAVQYEGGVNLQWIGDIDGDKQLDIILTVSNHYACWEVSLFLSSQAESGYFFKEVTKYQDCGC